MEKNISLSVGKTPSEKIPESLSEHVSLSTFLSYTPKNIVCDLTSIFKDIAVIKSTTASPSLQMLAEINSNKFKKLVEYIENYGDPKVFVKIYPEVEEKDEKRFQMERALYQYLDLYIINNNIPNVIRYVMSFHCDNLDQFIAVPDLEIPEKMIDKFVEKSKFNYLVLERSSGKTLENVIKSYLEDKDYKDLDVYFPSIFFQMVYTLAELGYQNIRHNDCHSGNWFIEDWGENHELFYFISETKYFRIVTRYWVKLYDFDLSTSTDDKFRNPLDYTKDGNYCLNFGMCDSYSIKFDLFLILRELESKFDYGKHKNLEDFIINVRRSIILDKRLLYEDYCCKGFPYRLCMSGKGMCNKQHELGDDVLLSAKEALNLDTILKQGYVERYDFDGRWIWDLPLSEEEDIDYVAESVLDIPFYCSTSIKSRNPSIFMANNIYRNPYNVRNFNKMVYNYIEVASKTSNSNRVTVMFELFEFLTENIENTIKNIGLRKVTEAKMIEYKTQNLPIDDIIQRYKKKLSNNGKEFGVY